MKPNYTKRQVAHLLRVGETTIDKVIRNRLLDISPHGTIARCELQRFLMTIGRSPLQG